MLVEKEFEGKIDPGWLENIAARTLTAEGAEASEMSLLITGQERIRELNRQYRSLDEPTDVLSFALSEAGGKGDFVIPPDGVRHLGEVIISYPQAEIQAREQGHPIEKELAILVVHGVLHLLAYDHERPEMARRMRAREKVILQALGKTQ